MLQTQHSSSPTPEKNIPLTHGISNLHYTTKSHHSVIVLRAQKKCEPVIQKKMFFPAGQEGQVSHLPNKQEHRNIICQLNRKR